jgi:hypothetical protein
MVKSFGNLKKSQKASRLNELEVCLARISGGDTYSLLESYFKKTTGKELLQKITKNYSDTKLSSIMENLQNQIQKVPKKEQRIWASIATTVFSRRELQENFHFGISKRQFTNSRRIQNEQPKKLGRKSIEETTRENIINFSYENTTLSAHKTIQQKIEGEKVIIPVRYTSCCKRCLFHDFKNQFPTIKLSESCFRKNLPREIKSVGKKRTDLCTYCEEKKSLVKKIQVKFIF